MLPPLADDFVVEVDADDRLGAQTLGGGGHLLEGNLPRLLQFLFVGAGAPADDVPNAREEVAEDVGADDGFAGDDAAVVADRPAFDVRCGAQNHGFRPSP